MADRIQEILSELREAIKAEVREEVRAEIIAELGGAPKKPGPKPKAAPLADAKFRTGAERAMLPKVRKGVRRTPEEVEQAGRVILTWLKSNPGSRVDQMAAALQVPVKDLQLPVQALLAAKKLKKAGKLRGTTYTVRG